MLKKIQQLLKDHGHYHGAIDGIAGVQTLTAVKSALGVDLDTDLGEKLVDDANLKQSNGKLELSTRGIEIIKEFEGFRSAPYRDVVGIPTIGYGNTYYLDGRKVSMSDKPLTKDEAHELKMAITNRDFAPKVRQALASSKVRITQNMFDACVSLAYNIGVAGFAKSSVVRHLNAGNKSAAADAFLLWNKAGGKVVNGLTRRRQKERALFME